ncbi:hypothetical protein CH252_40665 [Rhodococcus sp. 06-1477-1B]|nr:hypothetical protein CH252_40665 [Rhodococcus sp. 06-1477-1B]
MLREPLRHPASTTTTASAIAAIKRLRAHNSRFVCVSSKVAIYVRQSVDHEEGIDRQLVRCRQKAAERGDTVVEEYRDNETSASKVRGAKSEWSRMLADAKAGVIDTILAVDMDRLLRTMRDLVAITDMGVRIVTVSGEIDTTSADGALRAQMLAAIAQFEVTRKAERQVRANEFRVTNLGLPVPGKRRFGFEQGNVEERPAEAEQVRRLYREVLAGASIFGLAKGMGKPPVRIREILANPAYAGWVVRQGVKYEAHESVARIVSREDWEAVQALLANPVRRTSPGNQIAFLASGIARCGVCGARMVKQSANYLCKGNLSHPTIKQTMLDEHLKWEAFAYVASAEFTPSAEITALAKRLSDLQRKRRAQQEMATWDGVDLAAIRAEIARLGRDIDRLEGELSVARSASVVEDVAEALRSEMDDEAGADWWEERWKNLSLDGKRQLLINLDIRVDNGRGLDRVRVEAR